MSYWPVAVPTLTGKQFEWLFSLTIHGDGWCAPWLIEYWTMPDENDDDGDGSLPLGPPEMVCGNGSTSALVSSSKTNKVLSNGSFGRSFV